MLRKTLVQWQDGSYDPYVEYYREVITGKNYQGYEQLRATPDEIGAKAESEIPCLGQPGDRHEPASRKIFREAKKALTAQQLKAWNLVKIQQRTEVEAAEAMGISQPAVSKLLKLGEQRITSYCKANLHRIADDSL